MRRRSFCKTLGAMSLCLARPLASGTAFAIDPFERPAPGRMKLSLAAYSLRKHLAPSNSEPKKMDLFDFVDYCAEQGVAAELTSYYFPEEVTDEYLFRLKRHCHLRGVSISGGAIRNDFCQTDSGKLEMDVAHTKKWVDHYAKLGAPAIRIFAGKVPRDSNLEESLERCAQVCEQACAYAAQKGVMLALENHGGVTAHSKDLLQIVKAVDSPAFGINFDSGNFKSTDDPYAELAMIAPFAVNAQIKVEIVENGTKGEADLPRIVRILKNAGYSGWLALEYEASEEPLEAIPGWLKQLKGLV